MELEDVKFSLRNYKIFIFFQYFRDQKKSLEMKIFTDTEDFAYFTKYYLSVTSKALISFINEVLSLIQINQMKNSKDRYEDFNPLQVNKKYPNPRVVLRKLEYFPFLHR